MVWDHSLETLTTAARSQRHVKGLTHNFYRYPARFSPEFAGVAIELFSKPSDLVYDPYMGGGTTLVEAMARGRQGVGSDINSLAVFVTRVKTTVLSNVEKESIRDWARRVIPNLMYHRQLSSPASLTQNSYIRNLNLCRARFIKKVIAIALSTLCDLPSDETRMFIRCALLRTAQWALDGRRTQANVGPFRERLGFYIDVMLDAMNELEKSLTFLSKDVRKPVLFEGDASNIQNSPFFASRSRLVDLVVTSPPYPGLHVLYHRWQVDGRKETPAPYWIIDCPDGQGDSHYNFGSRHQKHLQSYFTKSLATLRAVRMIMRPGAHMVQMIAFGDPQNQLPRYLANMKTAGFKEILLENKTVSPTIDRIWRTVPNRKWHASLQGKTMGSKEVVLLHVAD